MKKIKRLFLLFVVVTLILSTGCAKKEPEKQPEIEEPPVEEVSVKTGVSESMINKFCNIFTELKTQELYDAGFELGDIVTIRFLDEEVDAPFVTTYSDVTSLSTGIFALDDYDTITPAINMGDFATYYGIAEKQVDGENTTWKINSASGEPIEMVFTLKEKGGYLDEYMIMQLKYSNVREDYPQLSDEEFANFRNVATTGMGKNVLFRLSTTVDDFYNRAKYADKAARDHHIAFVLNLTDDEGNLISISRL